MTPTPPVFRRRQTYADVFRRIQTYSDVCRFTLTHWDVCRRTAAFNDSLHLGGQKISAVIIWESLETDPFKVYVFGENNSKFQKQFDRFYWEERNEKWWHHRRITSHEGEEMVATTLPPSQCWKLKCCQAQKFDHQQKIQHWSEGGRGSKSSRKLSHLCIFGAAWSAKVCRVILPKLAGSDFELSHTIFKCWQTHEIHQLKCRVESEKVQKDDEHEVLSDAIDAPNGWQNNIKHHKKRVPTLIPGGAGVYWIDQRATHRVFLF